MSNHRQKKADSSIESPGLQKNGWGQKSGGKTSVGNVFVRNGDNVGDCNQKKKHNQYHQKTTPELPENTRKQKKPRQVKKKQKKKANTSWERRGGASIRSGDRN